MRSKKVVALAIMLAAVAAIFIGISIANDYTTPVICRNVVSTQTVTVEPNGYGHLVLTPNSSQANNYFAITISNGTIRESCVSTDLYEAWLNGIYTLTWHETQTFNSSDYSMPISSFQETRYYIFWNPGSPTSKGVTLSIYQQWTEMHCDYSRLVLGFFLIVAGAVSGLAAAFWISKRVLLVVIALALIVSGVLLAINGTYGMEMGYSVNVPAGGWVDEPFYFDRPDYYTFTVGLQNSTINSAVLSQSDFEAFSQGTYDPHWITVQGIQSLGGTLTGGVFGSSHLVLSNTDAFDKQVGINVRIDGNTNSPYAIAIGIALIVVGLLVFYLANRSHLKEFNKALENQQ